MLSWKLLWQLISMILLVRDETWTWNEYWHFLNSFRAEIYPSTQNYPTGLKINDHENCSSFHTWFKTNVSFIFTNLPLFKLDKKYTFIALEVICIKDIGPEVTNMIRELVWTTLIGGGWFKLKDLTKSLNLLTFSMACTYFLVRDSII